MAYTRLNLSDGDVFNASHVSHIEDGIVSNESDITALNQSLTDKDLSDQITLGSMFTSSPSLHQVGNIIFIFGVPTITEGTYSATDVLFTLPVVPSDNVYIPAFIGTDLSREILLIIRSTNAGRVYINSGELEITGSTRLILNCAFPIK